MLPECTEVGQRQSPDIKGSVLVADTDQRLGWIQGTVIEDYYQFAR